MIVLRTMPLTAFVGCFGWLTLLAGEPIVTFVLEHTIEAAPSKLE